MTNQQKKNDADRTPSKEQLRKDKEKAPQTDQHDWDDEVEDTFPASDPITKY